MAKYPGARWIGAVATCAALVMGMAMPAAADGAASGLDGTLVFAHDHGASEGADHDPAGHDSASHDHASHAQAAIKTGDGYVTIANVGDRVAELEALSGRPVHAEGAMLPDGTFRLEAVTAMGAAAAPFASLPTRAEVAANGPRPMRIAVVVFDGYTGSEATLQQTFFGAGTPDVDTVKSVIESDSDGAFVVSGQVFGPYKSTIPSTSCSLGSWLAEGARAAAANGYREQDFDNVVVYATPQGCPTGGYGWLGRPGSALYSGLDIGAPLHEMGHNFGALHSARYNCADRLSYSCPLIEYGGDGIMGNQRSTLKPYFTAYDRMRFGWLPASAVKSVSATSQTYAITDRERPLSAGGTRLLQVARPDGTKLLVERYSSQLGAGLTVSVTCSSQLCSSDYGSNDVVTLTNLRMYGESFVDPQTKVEIQALANYRRSISGQVRICPSGCGQLPDQPPPPPAPSPIRVEKVGATVLITGTERDDRVRVALISSMSGKGTRFSVDAYYEPLEAGPGCTAAGGFDGETHWITCDSPTPKKVEFRLGAGNDRAKMHNSIAAIFDGGPGDDTMIGAAKVADVYIGGDGNDVVDYSERCTAKKCGGPLAYTIGGGPVSGQKRERDDIRADVERVILP